MKVACIGNEAQQQEWSTQVTQLSATDHEAKEKAAPLSMEWLTHPRALTDQTICFDFLYNDDATHQADLVAFQQKGGIVVVNAVLETSQSLPAGFVRINAWPGFLANQRLEMVCKDVTTQNQLCNVLRQIDRVPEWVPDQIGFIALRVICSIINEAYIALGEGVSDKKQIDLAMQLGTNYPLGPFAWAEKIGKKRVLSLLKKLSEESSRYSPAALIEQEANAN